MITGEGRGASKEAANRRADIAIAQSIVSSLSVVSHDTLSSKSIDGVPQDYNNFSETTKMEVFLPNRQSIKQLKPHYKEDGEFVSERYICVKDAAAPHMNSLKDLARALKNSPCKNTTKIYSNIYNLEYILSNLAQMSSEVKAEYDALKKEYQKKKVYWQDDGSKCSEIAFSVLSKKIKMEKSRCSIGYNLRFSCQEKCQSTSYNIECSSNPSLAIESCDGEKYSVLKAKEAVIGSDDYNKSTARENMIDNLSKADFFNEWEEELKRRIPQCTE
jgi:hypothetical protein